MSGRRVSEASAPGRSLLVSYVRCPFVTVDTCPALLPSTCTETCDSPAGRSFGRIKFPDELATVLGAAADSWPLPLEAVPPRSPRMNPGSDETLRGAQRWPPWGWVLEGEPSFASLRPVFESCSANSQLGVVGICVSGDIKTGRDDRGRQI